LKAEFGEDSNKIPHECYVKNDLIDETYKIKMDKQILNFEIVDFLMVKFYIKKILNQI
jgi:hypothetical protein